MTHRSALLPLLAPLALAGCGEREEPAMSQEEVAAELRNVRVEPGLWERQVQVVDVRGPGLPKQMRDQILARGSSSRYCLTPEQAARPDANFLAAQGEQECVYRGFAMREGQLTGSMICLQPGTPGEMRTRMEGSYGPAAYDMRLTMESEGVRGEEATVIEARTIGRRIGPCADGENGE